MTDRINRLRNYIVNHEHHILRQDKSAFDAIDVSSYKDKSLPMQKRVALRLKKALESEKVVFLPDERIAFTRTLPNLPDVIFEEELDEIKKHAYIHEKGYVTNIAPNYMRLISKGFDAVIEDVKARQKNALFEDKDFYENELIILNAIIDFADRYKEDAIKQNYKEIAQDLEVVPRNAPKTFRQALQMLRLIHYVIWVEGEYHVILGRFDQYMYPYLKADLDKGILTKETALEVLEDFFISCNKDTDLYPGLQQGDNGQSIMLGGIDKDGNDAYNLLSDLCMQASYELKVIDPKINLRVNKNTPRERLLFASKLTAIGLGFPQYSNDDVVIDGLVKLGYERADAEDYCVAACWEFIVPEKGMEIVNISALSFAKCVNDAIINDGEKCNSLAELLSVSKKYVEDECEKNRRYTSNVYMIPAPFMSLMFENCLENAKDISLGNKYNNHGEHGLGLGNAVDALSCFNHFVYETKEYSAKEYINMMKNDFVGYEEVRNKIVNFKDKYGNGVSHVDDIACELLLAHSNACKSYVNSRGGICRSGTGSANCYASEGNVGMTGADGKKKGQFLPANYTPSIVIKTNGPLSVVKSLTAPDLTLSINGGPATFEFSANSINSEQGVEKIALLVENFIKLGGHQLQLNVINKQSLIDAQNNPENYRNLIVRVWGWSGYFVELDKRYQDQIIQRADYSL